MNKARSERVNTYGFESPVHKLSWQKIRTDIIRQLCAAKTSVKQLSGELDPRIYNHPCVVAAYESAAKRGVKIEIIAGPVIAVDKAPKSNPVINTLAYLIKRMNLAKRRVTILVAGGANLSVFRSPYFRAAIEGLSERGVKINIKHGPPIVAADEKIKKLHSQILYGRGFRGVSF